MKNDKSSDACKVSVVSKIRYFFKVNGVLERPILYLMLLYGFVFTNSYLYSYSIPFPIEFSIFPSMLFVVGILSLGFIIILFAYFMMIGLFSYWGVSKKYHYFVNNSVKKGFSIKPKNYLVFGFFTYMIPICVLLLMMLSGFFGEKNFNLKMTLFLFFLFFYNVIYSAFFFLRGNIVEIDNRRSIIEFSGIMFAFQILGIASFSFFIVVLFGQFKPLTNIQFLYCLLIYMLVVTLSMIPLPADKESDQINLYMSKEEFDLWLSKSVRYPVLPMLLFFAVLCGMPFVASKVGSLPIKLLNLGQKSGVTLTAAKNQCHQWPDEYIKKSEIEGKTNNVNCRTIPLFLVIKLGNRAYVLPDDNVKAASVVSLNVQNASIIRPVK